LLNIFLHIFPQWKSTVLDYSIYREYYYFLRVKQIQDDDFNMFQYIVNVCWYTSQYIVSGNPLFVWFIKMMKLQCSPCLWLQRGPFAGSGPAWRRRRVSTPCSRSNPSPRCHRDWCWARWVSLYLQWLFIFHMYIIRVLLYTLHHIYIYYYFYY
jgi:hypothetical protein